MIRLVFITLVSCIPFAGLCQNILFYESMNLGQIHQRDHEFDLAIGYFEQALLFDSVSPFPHYNLTRCLIGNGQLTLAEEHLIHAIQKGLPPHDFVGMFEFEKRSLTGFRKIEDTSKMTENEYKVFRQKYGELNKLDEIYFDSVLNASNLFEVKHNINKKFDWYLDARHYTHDHAQSISIPAIDSGRVNDSLLLSQLNEMIAEGKFPSRQFSYSGKQLRILRFLSDIIVFHPKADSLFTHFESVCLKGLKEEILSPRTYGFFVDRYLVNKEKSGQRYGLLPWFQVPFENILEVDAYRKTIGLSTLNDHAYIRNMTLPIEYPLPD